MLSPNTILQKRYLVVRKLGEGGMGAVYEAIDQRVSCVVALKETLTTRDGEARNAFEREAALLANLRHQALPKVMDYFSENEGDFLVMEFIPGYDLAEMLDLRGGPFPQSQVLRWAHDLLRVLEYLHGKEPPILHRDIKPSNLKLTKQGEIFLLDFGLAKGSLGQMPTLATSRSVRGYTPVYASLEQIHGHGTDARSDIYSLAATLYHLLTGVAPIDAPTRFHAVEDDQADPLQPIDKLNPLASANVAEVVHQAMAVSRKQRPGSAAEMRKALRNAAEEDERHSAEEEYHRAEERRRELEEEKRRVKDEAAERAAEIRRAQDAATRKKAEEARLQEAERQQREEGERRVAEAREAQVQAARQRAEADARQGEAPPPMGRAPVGPTVASAGPTSPTERPVSQPALQTIPAPPPEKLITSREDGGAPAGKELTGSKTAGTKRIFLIAAAVLVLAIVGVIIVWSWTRTTSNDLSASTQSQPQTVQPSKPADVKPPPGMVHVPGGTFMMGVDRSDADEAERPAHQVTLKPFFIDTFEVTNEAYEKFVKATRHSTPFTWVNGSFASGAGHQPVTGITWYDANAYAKWTGKRLPTEEEWEFAARGTDGRRYPWGNDWQDGMANADHAPARLSDVGSFKGLSPYGAYDMVGNAWELTASDVRAYPGGTLPKGLRGGEGIIIRGGSYASGKNNATTTYRGKVERGIKTYGQTGFRCVEDAK